MCVLAAAEFKSADRAGLIVIKADDLPRLVDSIGNCVCRFGSVDRCKGSVVV
jgi:hypothetical protein